MHDIATFYRFAALNDPAAVRDELLGLGEGSDVLGLLIVGRQGVNGSVSAPSQKELNEFIEQVESIADVSFNNVKRSQSTQKPFRRFSVRLSDELITYGQANADPTTSSPGTYVQPQNWNDLISQEDVLLIDTRNDYELKTGTFQGAVDPDVETFSEFAQYVDEHLSPETTPKVAMFCTGGIRCEVATTHLLNKGFSEVFHLQGGILKYLEEVPKEDSKWEGECFVFDQRVTVDHSLQPGSYELCVACSWPTPRAVREAGTYEGGATCEHCDATLSDELRARAKERWRQRQQAASLKAEQSK